MHKKEWLFMHFHRREQQKITFISVLLNRQKEIRITNTVFNPINQFVLLLVPTTFAGLRL